MILQDLLDLLIHKDTTIFYVEVITDFISGYFTLDELTKYYKYNVLSFDYDCHIDKLTVSIYK